MLALALVLAVASVEGVVTIQGAMLPGCTVTLGAKSVVSDHDGAYRFDDVEPGEYKLTFALANLETIERRILVKEGPNVQPSEEMRLPPAEEIMVGCPDCSLTEPETVWAESTCTDYELDDSLIVGIERGDKSAIAQAQSRYQSAATYHQKHRLGAALLRRVPDDSIYWKELFAHAENSVRFEGEPTGGPALEALQQWCDARGLPWNSYASMAFRALQHVMRDPRSRPLLRQALKSPNLWIAATAISGLAVQGDESALPAIAQVLESRPDDASYLAFELTYYDSEAADAIALRYLDENKRAAYYEAPEP